MERTLPSNPAHGIRCDGEERKKAVDEAVYDLLPGGRRRTRFPRADMAERLALSLVNEAARALGDGTIRSPRDGDIGAVFGISFPPFRGGPFRMADALGAAQVVEKLERLRQRHGGRFAPASLLMEKARSGGTFY